MSNKRLTDVWDNANVDGTELLVMLALADQANDQGYAWALHTTVAARARVHPDTAKRIIRSLVQKGLIERHERPGKSNLYRVLPIGEGGTIRPGDDLTRGQSDPPGGGRSDPPGGDDLTPHNPVLNPQENQNTSSADADDTLPVYVVPTAAGLRGMGAVVPGLEGFDEFWKAYPKKADKGAARKAWIKATKKTPAARVIAGASRYASDPNRDPQFTKNPATWLNAEAWDNDPLPPRMDGRRPEQGPVVQGNGTVDADAVLGRDVWSVPLPPDDIADALAEDPAAYQAWASERRAERAAWRQDEAKRVLRERGVAV